MGMSPTVAAGLAAEIVANEKVRSLAVAAFNGVYDRIFNKKTVTTVEALAAPPEPTEREMLRQIIATQPSNTEMSVAFAALQGELRQGQLRLWRGLAGIGVLNIVLLLVLIFK